MKVSRHPDWDQMYAAGYTAREIADSLQAPLSTVHCHVQELAFRLPDARAAHDEAKTRRTAPPSKIWLRHLNEVHAYAAEHGHLPTQRESDTAKVLYNWLYAQRHAFRVGTLTTEKETALQILGDWQESTGRLPQQQNFDERWRERLGMLIEFMKETGRRPSYKRYETEHERILGVWLHVQVQSRARHTLPAWRTAALNAAIPDWCNHQ